MGPEMPGGLGAGEGEDMEVRSLSLHRAEMLDVLVGALRERGEEGCVGLFGEWEGLCGC